MSTERNKQVDFNYQNGKVDRRFTAEWSKSGFINLDELPTMMKIVLDQKKEMIKYIEALHDKIDDLITRNNICHCPSCHTAGCTSDHK